jgi:heme/copper-type cytochrome/quinol oxidase subunit 2
MQMDIIVDTQEEYNKWIAEQQTWMQKQAVTAQTKSAESTTAKDSVIVENKITAQVVVPKSSH